MRYLTVVVFVVCAAALCGADTPCHIVSSSPNAPLDDTPCLSLPNTPFCYLEDDENEYCTPCNPNRATGWQCDCPPGSYCRPALPGIVEHAGTCVPFDFSLKACIAAADCDAWTYFDGLHTQNLDFRRFSCIGGYCRLCNQTYFGTGNYSCEAWDHAYQNGSSRPGETRWCDAAGYWQGTVLASNNPTTAAPPSPASGATTSSISSSSTTSNASIPSTNLMLFGVALALCTWSTIIRQCGRNDL